MSISFQEKRKEIKNCKKTIETNELIELYYEKREEFVKELNTLLKENNYKNSKKTLDILLFNSRQYDKSLAICKTLRRILCKLERILNIEPMESIDTLFDKLEDIN
jgi:hypothetical protein